MLKSADFFDHNGKHSVADQYMRQAMTKLSQVPNPQQSIGMTTDDLEQKEKGMGITSQNVNTFQTILNGVNDLYNKLSRNQLAPAAVIPLAEKYSTDLSKLLGYVNNSRQYATDPGSQQELTDMTTRIQQLQQWIAEFSAAAPKMGESTNTSLNPAMQQQSIQLNTQLNQTGAGETSGEASKFVFTPSR